MAASVSWNQMIAAGTQATDGRLCRPETSGPIAARSQRLAHIASPSRVPTMTESTNPKAPRLRLVQMASKAWPLCTVPQSVSATCAGPGRAYGGLTLARNTSSQTPTRKARNRIGGSTVRTKNRPGPGRGGSIGASSSASRPATTERSSLSGARRARGRSMAMAADLLVQLAGDLAGQRADIRRLDRARLGDAPLPLADDATGARAHEHDPLPEPGGLADVVGHEDDRQLLLGPDPLQLLVQDVAGDRVERGERLVHEQHRAVLGQRTGEGDALAHAAGELVHPLAALAAEVDHLEQPLGLGAALGLADAAGAQRQLDVGRGGQPRQQRRLLEHQGRALGRDLDRAGRGGQEARHDVEQRRLAAAGGAEQADELARLDGEVDALQDRGGAPLEHLRDALDADGGSPPGGRRGDLRADRGVHGQWLCSHSVLPLWAPPISTAWVTGAPGHWRRRS